MTYSSTVLGITKSLQKYMILCANTKLNGISSNKVHKRLLEIHQFMDSDTKPHATSASSCQQTQVTKSDLTVVFEVGQAIGSKAMGSQFGLAQ